VETPRTVLENVGARLIEIRLARGWTQEACAENLLVDVRLLRRIEAGRHNLTVVTLVGLALRLGVATRTLFEDARLSVERRPGRPRRMDPATVVAKPRAVKPRAHPYEPAAPVNEHVVSEEPKRPSRSRERSGAKK
jgi:transcriptional regulator with XRE-family HTH domain